MASPYRTSLGSGDKTVLVTGGGGYIGSHCIEKLLKANYDVIAVDNFANSVKGIGRTFLNFFAQ